MILQASSWEGLVPFSWWVELSPVPLVGRAFLRKTLSSLSADVWGCVPSLLVVWPEASQHWSLQVVRWG